MSNSTIFGDVNVKNIFTSHIDKKIISLTFFLTFYLYTFSLYENASLIIVSAEIGVFVVYIDTGSSMPISLSKSRELADENNKILTEWK